MFLLQSRFDGQVRNDAKVYTDAKKVPHFIRAPFVLKLNPPRADIENIAPETSVAFVGLV